MDTRTTVTITEAAHAYPIIAGERLLSRLGDILLETLPDTRKVFIVTDENVAPIYLNLVRRALEKAGLETYHALLPAGEQAKTLDSITMLYDEALAAVLKRKDLILALGGGIVGDITGFFAATYLRGVPFVQVPTTLLAQVDASVGGKVAVNWKSLKNMIGAFYHPHAVLIDTYTLDSLPKRELAGGMAEVIKYGCIEKSIPQAAPGPSIMSMLLQAEGPHELAMDTLVIRCCELKAAVVQADPQERFGVREILNLGHTFAHAYETLSQGAINHGEAVSIGMVKAFCLAALQNAIPTESVNTLVGLLERYNLPVESPVPYTKSEILDIMQTDKKMVNPGEYRLVLPYDEMGYVHVLDSVPEANILSVL